MFVSTDSFPDAVLARNCSCLLALYHLQPKLPLHQKLPEPYSSMWLKLTGMEVKAAKAVEETPSFACPFCDRVFEKEMGFFCCGFVMSSLKVHVKKDHKGEKLPETSPSDAAEDLSAPTTPAESTEKSSSPSASTKSGTAPVSTKTTIAPPSSTKSTITPSSSTTPGRRPVSDHRDSEELRSLSLESRSRFTSKYEQMMEEEKRRVARAQRENQRALREQLSKPPPVLLSEANQQFILSLLRDAGEETPTSESHNHSSSKETALTKELVRLGFPESGAAAAAKRCDSVSACVEWCCVHLEDSQLPPAFRAQGKQFEVTRNVRGAGETAARVLVEFGFSPEDAVTAATRETTLEKSLAAVCGALVEARFEKEVKRSWETVETEIEALKAIFNTDEASPAVSTETILDCPFLRFVAENEETPLCLFVVLSPLFGYPSRAPVVLLRSEKVTAVRRLAFTRCVFRRYGENCEGVLFEVFSDVAALLEQAEKETPAVARVLLSKLGVTSLSSGVSSLSSGVSSLASGVSSLSSGVSSLSSGVTSLSSSTPSKQPKPHSSKRSTSKPTPFSRVVDKQLLTGSPSAEVVSQRIALPIAQYRSQVLAMIRNSQVSILSGGTGCGKSTQVPQFLLEEFREGSERNLNIVVCEPRRISCLGLYNRVLEEQGFREGPQCPVGYQVRGDSK